jgi:hypothetical protein
LYLKYDINLSLSLCIIALIGCNLLNIGILLTYYYDNLSDKNEWVGVLSIRYYQFIIFGYFGMFYYYIILSFIFIAISDYKLIGIVYYDNIYSTNILIDRFKKTYYSLKDIFEYIF